MLAYRRDERTCNPAHTIGRLQDRTAGAIGGVSHDEVRELFIDYGELEAGVADWIFPERDGLHPLGATLRHGALAVAHALLASWKRDGRRRDEALLAFQHVLESLSRAALPASVPIRVSEGYAYYALHPETYAIAAERFATERRPGPTVCLGIRSIGTSLSGVVAAALEQLHVPVELFTVRPHGHPFDRQLSLGDDLARVLQSQPAHCHFAIMDEGPGLSGSSFTSVVRALRHLGIHPDRISLFPSWRANPASLRSEAAREVWATHRCYTAEAEEAGFSVAQISGTPLSVNFSAGAWRPHLLGDDERTWPAVQPQHEVPKAWIPERGSIVRFAGLGRYGAGKRMRAERLAGAGLGAPPGRLDGGYLELSFIEGTTCREVTTGLVDRIADHLAFVVREFPAERAPSIDELEEMTRTNISLGLGDVHVPDLAHFRAPLADAPCAAIDGRMLPHEWIGAGAQYWKVDALDHHVDHFFPGIQDAGWDLAAAAFEFPLGAAALDRLVTRYAAASGDRGIRARLPFYELAYPAFRLGYATLTRGSLAGTADAARFEAVIGRCEARLRDLVPTPSAP